MTYPSAVIDLIDLNPFKTSTKTEAASLDRSLDFELKDNIPFAKVPSITEQHSKKLIMATKTLALYRYSANKPIAAESSADNSCRKEKKS